MFISASELKNSLDECLDMAQKEDVYIVKDDKVCAVLSSAKDAKIEMLRSLYGCVSESLDVDKIKEKRLSKR